MRLVFGTVDLPDTSLAPRSSIASTRRADERSTSRTSTATASPPRPSANGSATDTRRTASSSTPRAATLRTASRRSSRRSWTRRADCSTCERIDVFVLHRDDPSLPVAAFADALLEQVAAGKIGGFGVSNWTVPRLRELQQHLDGVGEDGLVVFSNHFSLAEMVAEPWPGCLAVDKQDLFALADTDLLILAWSSLATGFFAGRDPASWDSPGNRARRERAAELAEELGTSAAAVALAYVFHQPEYVLPVVGTLSEAHLDEALSASEIDLSPAQVDWLESG